MPILVTKNHPARAEAEALIAGVYAHEYGATITTFADLLIALPGDDGDIIAAAGLRIGDGFFSEAYLERPIEEVLSVHWQPPATRDEIAEVTTLATTHPKSSYALFSAITGYLRNQDVRFAFFTVTERLHQILKRAGVPAHVLADAKADSIENAAAWGRYYASNPKVVAIHDAFVTVPATGVTVPAAGIASSDQTKTANLA